jgi:23S rRNA (cytosine1962-C5)-methyltransferase
VDGDLSGDPLVVTKAGEKAVRNRHHWIFSGAVARFPEAENGSMAPVRSGDGEHLGYAYFNRRCSLCARLVSFDRTPPLVAVRTSLEAALAIRRRIVAPRATGFRVCNAEADGIPGLILDLYGEVAVMQIGTLGLDRVRADLVAIIGDVLAPRAVYERSDAPSRREEGLGPEEGWRAGTPVATTEIVEDGLSYVVSVEGSQKTGFYLDQREMRGLVRSLAKDRRVLDCFCYTGGFSVAALAGGADSAVLVDSSSPALEGARRNLERNGVADRATLHREDCVRYLRERALEQDLVILDPPAFAKRRSDVEGAVRGYREINRLVLQKAPRGALLLSCSCSYHVDAALFQATVFRAARDAGRPVRILARHRLAADHPVNVFHPETEYLKSLLLEVG